MLNDKRIEIGNKKIDNHRFTVKRKSNIKNTYLKMIRYVFLAYDKYRMNIKLPLLLKLHSAAFYMLVNNDLNDLIGCVIIIGDFS